MKNLLKDRRGFVVVLLAAGLLVVLLAFAGLAIDVGRAYYVKGEVQNAADAAAFAGAAGLFANPPLATDPNFDAAKAMATEFVQKNQAAGVSLTAGNAQVEAGYWDLDAKLMRTVPLYTCAGTVMTCNPSGPPPPGCACQQRGVAAVRVTVQKPELPTYFGKIVGWTSSAPAAMSIAGRGYPTTAKVGFPFAITKCMIDYYMSLKLYGEVIKIPDAFAPVPDCDTGNWSSLGLLDNSGKSDKDILSGIATVPVTIGESIMFQQGTRADLFQLIESNFKGRTVVVPVVAENHADPNRTSTVTGFMELTVTDVVATGNRDGSGKYIMGTFKKYYEDGNPAVGGIGGTPSNTLSPPVLLK